MLCITESWLTPSIPDNFVSLKGFDLVRNDRLGKRGGGTCVFINDRIKYAVTLPKFSNELVEMQCISLLGHGSLKQTFKPIIIIVVYRPPCSNGRLACNCIKEYLNQIPDIENNELVIIGDLNWDLLDKNSQGKKLVTEIASDYGLSLHISSPTRWAKGKASLLDIILSNIKNIYAAGCLDKGLSDHNPIFIVKKREKIKRTFEYKRTRSYKSYNGVIFQDKLNNLDWSIFDILSDVDDMWNMLHSAISYEMNIMCPVVYTKVNTTKPIWYNQELYEVSKERDRLFKKFRRSKGVNEATFQLAVNKRNLFAKMVRTAKEDFYHNLLDTNKDNSQKFWKTMKDILEQDVNIKITQVYHYGTNHLCDESSTADIINNFFSSVGERIAGKLTGMSYTQLDEEFDGELCEFPLMKMEDFYVHCERIEY